MSDVFLGTLQHFAFDFAPRGWKLCNGDLLPRAQYSGLAALIGSTWGGDGLRTIGVPDARNRILVGHGLSPASGVNYVLGEHGGEDTVTLKDGHLPFHGHGLNASTGAADRWAPEEGRVLAKSNSLNEIGEDQTIWIYHPRTDDMKSIGGLSTAGAAEAFSIHQPTLTTNLSICVDGPYPDRPA
jgi:microcystin-dependent protein